MEETKLLCKKVSFRKSIYEMRLFITLKQQKLLTSRVF